MKNLLRCGTIVLALASGIGLAAAQVGSPGAGADPGGLSQPSQIKLSPAQKTAIFNAVRQDGPKGAAPTNFQASVGGPVPPSIELYTLPSGAVSQSPELRTLKYTMAQNQVVLVDPTTMRVIDIIRQ